MRKEQILIDSKNYLISVHDTLRKAFRTTSPKESIFVAKILEGIEQDIKQIEILEEMMELWKTTKSKKLEMIETKE